MVHFSLFCCMGHRPHYRESLGTTSRNDVSQSLASMVQEDQRTHANFHVDKCLGMGRLVLCVCIVDKGLWRWASSQTRFPIMQRDISCAKEVHRRSFLLPSWWSCDLSYALPHMSCRNQSAYHVGCSMDARMFHRGNASILACSPHGWRQQWSSPTTEYCVAACRNTNCPRVVGRGRK